MIEVRHLSKKFGNITAVDDLSFTVEEGETFVLLGTSGCGKTTTLKMINRLIDPDSGTIFIDGQNTAKQKPELLRRKMGYVLQNTGLFPHYTIAENISVVPDLLNWDKTQTKSRAEILLQKFDLPPETYLSLYPDQLSGGQQQRVGFARSLMANPPILLMDEPLGALDPVTRHQIRKEFKQLDELIGKTIILVTHDVSEAIELGDRICLMNEGRIIQTGTAAELLLHPKSDFVKDFFANDRFLLQLKALQLKDLFAFFQAVEPSNENPQMVGTLSLLDAIEQLSGGNENKRRIVVNENENLHYAISLPELLQAFQQKVNAVHG